MGIEIPVVRFMCNKSCKALMQVASYKACVAITNYIWSRVTHIKKTQTHLLLSAIDISLAICGINGRIALKCVLVKISMALYTLLQI